MKLFLLALCAAIALSRRIPESNWIDDIVEERYYETHDYENLESRAGKEFRFIYNGQLTSGIPTSSKQHSASRIQAVVTFIAKTNSEILFQMTHVRIGQLNRVLPSPRAMTPFEAFEEVEISPEQLEILRLPLRVNYVKGNYKNIQLDGREETWSVNIKRGILNIVQLNLEKERRTDLVEETDLVGEIPQIEPVKPFDHFSAYEETIEGDCEAYYTVTSEPTNFRYGNDVPVLNVTKSINYEKCKTRPEIKYNFRSTSFCPACERKYQDQNKFLESSTVARYNLTGTAENYVIQSARVESQYTYTPYNEQGNVLITYVNQTLTLITYRQAESEIPEPQNSFTPKISPNLIYSLDWDIKKEDFYMEGETNFAENAPFSRIQNKVQYVSEIMKTLAKKLLGVKEDVPKHFARLVQALRYCKISELERIFVKFYKNNDEFSPEQNKQIKDLLVDALAIAGTKDSIELLVKEINSKRIPAGRAAIAIKSVTNLPVVSETIVDKIFNLGKSPAARQSPVLKQSAFLTAGSLIGALCRINYDKIAKEQVMNPEELCPKSLKQRYVQMIEEELEQSENTYEKILVLKMASNAGIDLMVYPLEKIIRNQNNQYPIIVRQNAIEALRKLRDIMPVKIQKILMPVYMNQHELPELRMAAFAQIMQTLPSRAIVDQITEKLFTERSRHVAAFVYTYLTTLSNSENPCEKKLAEDIQLSLRQGRRVPYFMLPYLSRYYHRELYNPVYKTGFGFDMGVIKSNVSYLPKDVAFSLHQTYLGYWQRYLATVGIQQTNTEDIISQVLKYARNTPIEESLRRSPRDLSRTPKQLLKHLFKQMEMQERRYVEDEMTGPMALLYLRFRDEESALLPISAQNMPETLKNLIVDSSLDFGAIERFLEEGYNFNQNIGMLMFESSAKIPTTMGMPLQLNIRNPTVLSAHGKAKATIEPEDSIRRVSIFLKGQAYLVSEMEVQMESWTPILTSGVKVVAESRVHLPVHFKVEYNSEKTPTELRIVTGAPEDRVKLLSVHTRPVTYTRVLPTIISQYPEPQEKTIYGEKWDRINRDETKFGKYETGLEFTVRRQWHRTPMMVRMDTPLCLLAGPNKLEVIVEPGFQPPKQYVLELTGGLSEILKDELHTPVLLKKFFQTSEKYFDSEESSSFEDSSLDQSEESFDNYVNEYETRDPEKSYLKAKLQAHGSSVERKLELLVEEKCDSQGKHCQFLTKIERTPIPEIENEPWKLTAKAEVIYPETAYTLSELSGKKMLKNVVVEFGPQSNPSQQFVDIKIEGERSREQEGLIEEQPYSQLYENEEYRLKNRDIFSPVSQYDQIIEAATLTQFKIKADYKLNVPARNVTNKLWRAVKYMLFPNTEVAQINVRNPEGKVYAKVNICPKTYRYLNVTAWMPKENVTMLDVPSPIPLYVWNVKRSQPLRVNNLIPTYSNSYYGQMGVCKVESRQIETFDQVRYRVPLTTCYSVIAKDCSNQEEPSYAVLLKKLRQNSEQKKLKVIVAGSVVEVYPEQEMEDSFLMDYSQQNLKVIVNGEEKDISDLETLRTPEIKIKRDGPVINVYLREQGVKVYFDGYTAQVKVSPSYQRFQCGLCGDYNSEQTDEFVLPNGEVTHYPSELHRAYLYRDSEECEMTSSLESLLDNEEEYEYSPLKYERSQRSSYYYPEEQEWNLQGRQWDSEEIDDQDLSYEDTRSYSGYEPRPVTKVIEHSREICFSKKPALQCPKHTYATEWESETKQVKYGCISRSESQSENLRVKLLKNPVLRNSELQSLESSFTKQEALPKRCALL